MRTNCSRMAQIRSTRRVARDIAGETEDTTSRRSRVSGDNPSFRVMGLAGSRRLRAGSMLRRLGPASTTDCSGYVCTMTVSLEPAAEALAG